MWILDLEKLILEEMISEWESFLFSKDVYWPGQIRQKNIPIEYKNIRISAGRLLISFKLLSEDFRRKEIIDQSILDHLDKFQDLRNRWKANWEKKIEIEIPVRIRQWQRIIQDITHDRDYSHFQMSNDLQIRMMLDLLFDELGLPEKTNYFDMIRISDLKFRSLTEENNFVWKDQFSAIFPEEKFWYLYRTVSNTGGSN